MDLNKAVEGLVFLWIRDIAQRELLPAELMEARLFSLEILLADLSAQTDSHWFLALPKGGGASRFHSEVFSSVLRRARIRGSDAVSLVTRYVDELQRDWSRGRYWELGRMKNEGLSPSSSRLERLRRWLTYATDVKRPYDALTEASAARLYFAFVEDTGQIRGRRSAFGPNGRVLMSTEEVGPLLQIRFSAILCEHLFEGEDRIDSAGSTPPADSWRQNRLEQLREQFGRTPIPVIDLVAPLRWRLRADVGTWWVMGVGSTQRAWESASLFFSGEQEAELEQEQPASLEILTPVPPYWGVRLRDIFSLEHIPDADFGDGLVNPDQPRPPALMA